MSETGSTTNYVDVTSDTWEEYFGATEGSETIVDILGMTEEDWAVIIDKYGTDVVSEFRSEFESELDEKSFSTIINGTINDLEEINTEGRYDEMIAELEALSGNCDLEPIDEAINTYNAENVDLTTAGTSATHTEDPDVVNGTTYTYVYSDDMDLETFYLDLEEETTLELASYDATTGEYIFRCTNEDGAIFYLKFVKKETTTADSGTLVSDPHPDWFDSDGDGYGDLELEYDANGNLATDLNGDGVVDQTDVELAEGHEGFDLVMTGGNGNLTEAELTSWPPELSQHFYESSATQASGNSAYNLLNPDAVVAGSNFVTYNMDAYGPANASIVDIDLSTTDAANITINCQAGVTDTISISNLPADAVWSVDANGTIIITIPSTGQTITITGAQTTADGGTPDAINVTGDGLTSDIATTLHNTGWAGWTKAPSTTEYAAAYGDSLASIVTINGQNLDDYYYQDNYADDYAAENPATGA